MSLPDSLPHLVDLKRALTEEKADGSDTQGFETFESGRACWVQPAGKNTIIEFQRRSQNVTHTVYFKGDPGLSPGCYIFPTTGPWAGRTLEVKASDETTAGLGLLWACTCQLLQAR